MRHNKNSSIISQLFQLIVVAAIIGGIVYLVKRLLNPGGKDNGDSKEPEDAEIVKDDEK